MIEALRTVFGESVREEEYVFPTDAPMYMKYGYDVCKLYFDNRGCLMVTPKEADWNLGKLKTQIKNIEDYTKEPVIAHLDKITALQRTNLIVSKIAFVSGSGQIFVPYWGAYFEERIKNPIA